MADVFFSYKREDQASVSKLVRLLEREDLGVWWDTSLVAGERFANVIQREIEKAKCVIVAWSANSINAVWVQDEASLGRDRGILVPLSLDGARPPLSFRGYQTPDLSGWDGDPDDLRIRQLIDGVLRLVRSSADGQPTTPPTRVDAGGGEAGSPARASGTPLLPRRRLLRLGVATGIGGLLAAGGWWVGQELWSTAPIPATRTEEFDVVTVNARGEPQRPQPQSMPVFAIPVGDTRMEFSVIPAGTFQIGSPESEPQRRPNEGPQIRVAISGFAMGRTAVTQDQWAALIETRPGPIMQTLPARPWRFVGGDLPVEGVSWEHATEFCQRMSAATGLGIRLPSEAEWEYACRAGTNSAFHFGPTVTPNLANYCGTGGAVGLIAGEDPRQIPTRTYGHASYDSGSYADGPRGVFNGTTKPVRSYPPNYFGLFEMHGNVWEHCNDTISKDYQDLPTDGSPYIAAQDSYVLRGGSWSHNPAICRSAYRDFMPPDYVGWPGRVGLRLVCELGGTDRAT